MELTKKLYIIIGVLILVVLIIFLVGFFTREKPSQVKEGEPKTSLCPEKITYQKVDYKVVEIGGKCWLAENLRTSVYRDGTAIAKLTDSDEWKKDKEGAYTCYYNQDNYCQDYGALYNWYAVNNDKGLCPEGWSVPNQKQWAELERAVCQDLGYQNCQERFPDENAFGWRGTDEGWYLLSTDLGGKDKYGFRAIFGGFRNTAGPFDFLGERGFWWTATPSEDFAFARVIDKTQQGIRRFESSKSNGFSVRCVKD
jgi:uncharacterized protein (TIGR02145 family)